MCLKRKSSDHWFVLIVTQGEGVTLTHWATLVSHLQQQTDAICKGPIRNSKEGVPTYMAGPGA